MCAHMHTITIKDSSTINVYFKLQHTYVAARLSNLSNMYAHVWGMHVGDERVCGRVSAAAFVSHFHKESSFRSHLKTFFFCDGVFTCWLCVEVGDLTGAGLGLGSHCLCMTVL